MADRLDRLVGRGHGADLERTIAELAARYGLDPAEVRAELAEIEAHDRRFGPPSAERVVRRCAEEFGIPEAEVWDEYAVITGASGGRA